MTVTAEEHGHFDNVIEDGKWQKDLETRMGPGETHTFEYTPGLDGFFEKWTPSLPPAEV